MQLATLDTIAADFAATVKQETGIAVEFTMTSASSFTVSAYENTEHFPRVIEFVKTIPGVTLKSVLHYDAIEGENPDEDYAYFVC